MSNKKIQLTNKQIRLLENMRDAYNFYHRDNPIHDINNNPFKIIIEHGYYYEYEKVFLNRERKWFLEFSEAIKPE